MIIESIWLTKLLLSHLLTDFILQSSGWIEDRKIKHFGSPKLYLHGIITALAALLLLGCQYWIVALAILVTHTLIDGWKSYQQETITYFLIDQLMHILVIIACWYFSFLHWKDMTNTWKLLNTQGSIWTIITAVLFLTTPAGIFIGKFTKQWRDKVNDAESLANAGKWIGITERIIVFILVLNAQYSAIGLLVTAKGIIRFNEKDRQETKTEYLVIGTMLSIGMAIVTGVLVKA